MSSTTGAPRFFANDISTLRVFKHEDAEAELVKVLNNVVSSYPPQDSWPTSGEVVGGLYCGPTGIAYLFMTVAKDRPELSIAGKTCHVWAGLYLEGERPRENPTLQNCAVICEATCHTAIYAAYHHSNEQVKSLVSHTTKLLDHPDDPEDAPAVRNLEYCYGLAGLLYLLRLVRTWYPASSESINPAISKVIGYILANGPPWVFSNMLSLLGPGHGDMGIIFQIVRSDPTYATHSTVCKVMEHILDEQLENGNWRSGASNATVVKEEFRAKTTREMVQWCHGAPGMVQCLVLLRPYFTNLAERIDTAVEKGRDFTWKEGLLTKEPNMCHGITGNAFAFPPGEKRDHFLSFTTEEEVEKGLESGKFEKCDYGVGHALGFGAPGRAVGWLWRTRDAEKEGFGCYVAFDDI